ncbi:MAG: hypothetical protein AAF360_19925, partial [Pseudomonadota bacterium]
TPCQRLLAWSQQQRVSQSWKIIPLQLAGRIDAMTPHARWLFDAVPDDPRSLRYGVQVGVWGGAPDLAEAAYARLEQVDPRQADAARRFIDNPPPRPPER